VQQIQANFQALVKNDEKQLLRPGQNPLAQQRTAKIARQMCAATTTKRALSGQHTNGQFQHKTSFTLVRAPVPSLRKSKAQRQFGRCNRQFWVLNPDKRRFSTRQKHSFFAENEVYPVRVDSRLLESAKKTLGLAVKTSESVRVKKWNNGVYPSASR
jgi:hypothetical protein